MSERIAQEVIAYFKKKHGPVEEQAAIEIVPSTMPPIAFHAIKPGKKRDFLTLFTTGMSDEAMTVPAGEEEWEYAEFFLQVPANWTFGPDDGMHADLVWLMQSIRNLAGTIHETGNWLGGPVTIFATSEPPEPLAPHVEFTSLLVIAKEDFVSKDGRTVHLYQVMPLHPEERQVEIDYGIASLMRAFDRHDVSFVIDLERPPVKTAGGGLTVVVWLGCGVLLSIPILLLLWIWIPYMGWAALGALVVLVGLIVIARLWPE